MHFAGHREGNKEGFMEHTSVVIGASGNLLLLHIIIIGETKPRLLVAYTRKGDFRCASLGCELYVSEDLCYNLLQSAVTRFSLMKWNGTNALWTFHC